VGGGGCLVGWFLQLFFFNEKYGEIQSVIIPEVYIMTIYKKSRSKFLSSARSSYPTKSFLRSTVL
jgi:hypothetical protein